MIPIRLRVLVSRTLELVFRRRREARLAEEIEGHLHHLAEQFVADGMTPDDARAAARRAFGGVERITASHRDQRGLPGVEAVFQDLRFAVRLLLKDRAFALTTIFALALGIGAATTVFTIVKGMNLQSLPVESPGQIVYLQTQHLESGRQGGLSYPDFVDWREAARSFSGLAALSGGTMNVGDDTRPADRLGGSYVSANAFVVLRVRPALGRDLRPEDDVPGAPPVVLLSHGVWTERYGNDPTVVGRTIRVNGVPTIVIGIMPEGFRFPLTTDVWQPIGLSPAFARERREARTMAAFGRLRDEIAIDQARAELTAIASALASQYPATNSSWTAAVTPFTEQFAGRLTDPAPLMLMIAVAFVLLISCVNAANLLLSRAVYRAREISLRAAMGASRGRLVRQLLVESLTLAAIACAVGLAFSLAGVRLFTSETADFNLPYWMDFSVDLKVFAFLATICVVTAVLFGLAPAWQLATTSAHDVIKEGGRGATTGLRSRRWTGALLVGELALTIVLLTAAGLALRSAAVLFAADEPIATSGLMTSRLSLPAARYATADRRRLFQADLQRRIGALVPVASATIANAMPFIGAPSRQLLLEGAVAAPQERPTVAMVAAGERYFETLGVAILRGRGFAPRDALPGQEAAIVNERFAERFFGSEDPLGQRVRLLDQGNNGELTPWLTIVGVSPAIRQAPASAAGPVVYLPLDVVPQTSLVLLVRGRPGAGDLTAAVRQEVHRMDPDLALFGFSPLERASQQSRWIPRAMSTALSIVGTLGLLLSAMGLYGVTAYGVAQRTSEIGIRMALGSPRSAVWWLFLRSALVRLGLGLMVGVAGGAAAGQLLRGVLTRVSSHNALTIGVPVAILGAVALIATVIPVRRATRVDPAVALRHES